MQVGDRIAWERAFTEEEVRLFTRLTGDAGTHHVEKDAQGRLMVHGLLTATLPTKVGGDLNFIAREMVFEFVRPVYTGDVVRCEVTIAELAPQEGRLHMAATFACTNRQGKDVLHGRCRGVIRQPPPPA